MNPEVANGTYHCSRGFAATQYDAGASYSWPFSLYCASPVPMSDVVNRCSGQKEWTESIRKWTLAHSAWSKALQRQRVRRIQPPPAAFCSFSNSISLGSRVRRRNNQQLSHCMWILPARAMARMAMCPALTCADTDARICIYLVALECYLA